MKVILMIILSNLWMRWGRKKGEDLVLILVPMLIKTLSREKLCVMFLICIISLLYYFWAQIDKGLMAPTRKSRSVNKRFSSFNEASPDKDGVNTNKNKHRVCDGLIAFLLRLEKE